MGLVGLIANKGDYPLWNSMNFEVMVIDNIQARLSTGDLDIAMLPANLAANIYQKTSGAYKVAAINTLGVIYIVDTTGEVTGVESLRGKTIIANGLGSTPEYALRHILIENGINPDTDVTLEFKQEPTEVVSVLAQSGGIALLQQPFVASALDKVQGLQIALDLTEEWDNLSDDSSLVTGVMVVRSEFAELYPEKLKSFMKSYADSAHWVNENPAEAAVVIEEQGIIAADIAEKAIPFCHITFISGEAMKTKLSGYLEVLLGQNPQSIGGSMPDDGFYLVFPEE